MHGTTQNEQLERLLEALLAVLEQLSETDVVWALTGSLGHRLQGVPVEPNDIDIQTDAAGAYRIGDALAEFVVNPVRYAAADHIRSHLGEFAVDGVKVEVIGAVQKKLPDGAWETVIHVADHMTHVAVRDATIPVMTLACEWRAYERLGRPERAALLRHFAQQQT